MSGYFVFGDTAKSIIFNTRHILGFAKIFIEKLISIMRRYLAILLCINTSIGICIRIDFSIMY